MMRRVFDSDNLFGVVLIKKGVEAMGPLPLPFSVGCTARVVNVTPFPDGRFNLMAIGEQRFTIQKFHQDLSYLTADVRFEEPVDDLPDRLTKEIVGMKDIVSRYVKSLSAPMASDGLSKDEIDVLIEHFKLPEEPVKMLFMACGILQIPTAERQSLLETFSISELIDKTQRIFRREIAVNQNLYLAKDAQKPAASQLN